MEQQDGKMTKEQKQAAKKYGQMMSDYLIDCCMLYELACQRRSKADFDAMALELYNHWDEFTHYHKAIVDKEKLKTGTAGETMKFPKLLRQIACHTAKKYTGNPMTKASDNYITGYVKMWEGLDLAQSDLDY